jgi:putative salt-induced outer membrane protein
MKEKVMKKSCYALTLASLLMSVTSVNAEEKKADESPWTASVELGFIKTTGNTETQTIGLKADATYEVDKWRHTGHAEAFGQENEDDNGESVVSAERYELSGKSDYKFTERDYAYGIVHLRKDRFSGFEYDHIVSAGYGRKAIKRDDMELDLEIGPGMRLFKVDDGSSEDEGVLRLSGVYWWDITGNSKFTQELTTEIGEEITSTRSVTGIQANINSTLALRFTYTIRHKSEVPADTEKKDTETAMTLVYNF